MTREHHPAVASLAKASRRSRDRDRKVTGSYEGSLTMEGIPDPTSHRFSRFDGDEDLGGSLPCRKRTRRRAHWARKSGEATGMSEARSRSAPWEESRPRSLHPGREIRGFVSSRRSAEAVSGVVKRSVLRSSRTEPKLCGVSTRRKLRQRTGNARGAGTRKSYGWQKSFGRIARLARREIARSRGGTQGASQKEARSTA